MAEKDQPGYPLAPANGHARSDEESATAQSKEVQKKRNIKCLAYVAAFIVFQTIIILVFALTVMKIKNPKFRVRSATTENFIVGTPTNPSFSMTLNAQVTVKNTNFGHFKFDNSTITFAYRGISVGEALVFKARARARSTKKIDIVANLGLSNLLSNSDLASDITSGILPLTSQSKLNGKVHLMKVIKKKKSAEMKCTMEVVLATQAIQNLKCK